MTTLAETQRQLLAYLQGQPSTIRSLVTGKNTAFVERRLEIYREAYQLRLHDNLSKQFPVLRAYLQGSAFDRLAALYLAAYPPTHFAIRHYGEQLATLLQKSPEYATQPTLCELAQCEWLLTEIVDQSPTQPVLTATELAQLTPERLNTTRFYLQPHWRLQVFSFDTPPWRDALKRNPKTPAPPALETPKHYAFWRKGFQTYYHPLNAMETALAMAIQQGQTFAELCQVPTEKNEADTAQLVAQTLLSWVHNAWFVQTQTHG